MHSDRKIMPNIYLQSSCFYYINEKLNKYLDNETDIELVDSIKSNLLKTVKVFQKPYYQEKIKGEVVNVSSWRMKEKVRILFYFVVIN